MADPNPQRSGAATERRLKPPYFFTFEEYRTLQGIASRIIPTGEPPAAEPGAAEVGTVNYVDSWILDESESTQRKFRVALRHVNQKSLERFGTLFSNLAPDEQHNLLRDMTKDRVGLGSFETLRAACIDGFYSDYRDPWYDGPAAWQLVGFQGKRISELQKDWSFLRIYKTSKQTE